MSTLVSDKLNIARDALLCPVGGEAYRADVVLSTPPDSSILSRNNMDSNTAKMNCINLQNINNKCRLALDLLSNERVEAQNKYFYKKYLYMIESNTLGTYNESKREISGQISTIMSRKSLYAIETAICCLEGILLIFKEIPKKKIQIELDINMLEELQNTLYDVPIEQFNINLKKIRDIEKSINILEYYESFELNYDDFREFADNQVNEIIEKIG